MDQPEMGRDWRHALVLRAENADWAIREAAWSFEEQVLWRGGDVSREALGRAGTAIAPLHRLIQTRLTWPLADFLHHRGTRTRVALAASAVALTLAAAGAGAITAPDHPSAHAAAALSPAPAPHQVASQTPALQGVAPQFHPARAAPPPPQPPAKTATPPAQVAWQFAQAFVGYEVGKAGQRVDEVFGATATKPLAKALAADPPRLPAGDKVPRARVLNIVLGAHEKSQVTASVSLVRLRAISELRLTLTRSGDGWRVAQVLG
jgi:hypothetical protein